MKLIVIAASIMTISGMAFAQTNSTGTVNGVPNGALNSGPGMANGDSTDLPKAGALNTQQQSNGKNSDRYAKAKRHTNRDFPPSSNGNGNATGSKGSAPDLNQNADRQN